MTDRFLRFRDIQRITGLSKSTVHRHERAGLFPQRRRIGVRAVAWLESEVAAWMQSRSEVEAYGRARQGDTT